MLPRDADDDGARAAAAAVVPLRVSWSGDAGGRAQTQRREQISALRRSR
jgi:hypothetical protein